MSTRAVQIELLLSGVRDATTSTLVAGGTAYFYEAGTTAPKNVLTEKEKTNPFPSYTLSAIGTALLYGDGIYKIDVLTSTGAQVSGFPRDNVKIRHPNYYTRAVTATTTQTSDDDFLEVNTTSGAVTINLLASASWVQPLKVMHTSGANAITLEPNGAELIDGSANYTFTAVGTIVEVVADAAGTALRKAGIRSTTLDADGDTGIELDRTADNDTIHFKTAGVDRVVINATATDVDALSIAGTLQTTTATEINQLHSQGAVAADFAKLHAIAASSAEIDQCNDKTLVNTTDNQNIGGAKTFTAGLNVTGGPLLIEPETGTVAEINTTSSASTSVSTMAGGYTVNESARSIVFSKDDIGYPGEAHLWVSTGGAERLAVRALNTGVVDFFYGATSNSVALATTTYTSFAPGGDFTSGTVHLAKTGRNVTMTIGGTFLHSGIAAPQSAAGVIPAAYRPVAYTTSMFFVSGGHTSMAYISTAGTFTFYYYDHAVTPVTLSSSSSGSISWVSAT